MAAHRLAASHTSTCTEQHRTQTMSVTGTITIAIAKLHLKTSVTVQVQVHVVECECEWSERHLFSFYGLCGRSSWRRVEQGVHLQVAHFGIYFTLDQRQQLILEDPAVGRG
jgi:hypothetical protein